MRPKTILCTVGTSIANSCPSVRNYQQSPSPWSLPADDLRSEIQTRLASFDLSSDSGRSRASAEINSLNRLGISPDDTIHLLATDTADGRACAELLASSLASTFSLPATAIKIHQIKGLQVRDSLLLRSSGIHNLIDTCTRILKDPQVHYSSDTIINPTGGFKGIVPFLTVLGMIFRTPCVYIFEFSDSLIHLPPLPVTFDIDLFSRALPALDLADKQSGIPEDLFFQSIQDFQPHERELFQSLVEPYENLLLPSPLVRVFQEISHSESHEIRIHSSVQKKFDSASPLAKAEITAFLARAAHPLWRSANTHPFSSSQLSVFGRSRGNRIAGFTRPDAFYVTHIYLISLGEHSLYEKELTGKSAANFPLSDFLPWTPPATLKDADDDLLAITEETRQKNDSSPNIEKLRHKNRKYKETIQDLESSLASAKQTSAALRQSLDEQTLRNQTLQQEIATLKAEASTHPH